MKTVKLFDPALWDKAKWIGVTLALNPMGSEAPRLGLIFEDGGAALLLFQDLIERIGSEDPENLLRVAIIEGFIAGQHNPGYSVKVGPRFDKAIEAAALGAGDSLSMDVAIINASLRVVEKGPVLQFFKKALVRHGRCYIVPVAAGASINPHSPIGIWSTSIVLRHAEDIRRGAGDEDEGVLR